MSGYDRMRPGRKLVDEIISTGQSVGSPITGVTSKFVGNRWSHWTGPFLPPSTSAYVLVATASTSGGTTTVTAGLSNPDFARAVRVAPSTSQLASTSVIVSGTNQFGTSVTDTIVMASGSPVNGAVAFKTITSILLPASTSTAQGSPTFTIGLSNVFGVDRTVPNVAAAIRGAVNGTAETTAPIMNATNSTVSFTTSATSSAGASLDLIFVHADAAHS